MSVLRYHDAMSLDSARRRFFFLDHFLGDQIQDLWNVNVDVGGSVVVIDAQTGGIIRFTTDVDINDDGRIEWNNVRTLHVDQQVCMEIRLKLTQITNVIVDIQLRQDANNTVQFLFDTSVDGNWHAINVDGGAPTNTDSGVAATTSYIILRMETLDTPSVAFYIDDVLVATHTTNVPDDAGDFLQPYLFLRTLENLAKSMDVDYVVISQER